MDDLSSSVQGRPRSNAKMDLNWQHTVFLSMQYGHISDRMATARHFVSETDDLEILVQGHPRSYLKMDLNSQHMGSYLLSIQYIVVRNVFLFFLLKNKKM